MKKTLLLNGLIYSMQSCPPFLGHILIKEDKIFALNEEALAAKDSATEVFDLKQKAVIPGLVDTHTHFFEYAKRRVLIDLSATNNLDEVAKVFQTYCDNKPSYVNWIGGSGWNKNLYPSLEGFNRYFIDRFFPDIPVSLESKDMHSKWCNSRALQIAGISKNTPDPEGGRIGRFVNGEPDGFLYERAWELISRVQPDFDSFVKKDIVKQAVEDSWKYGLTGIHVMEEEEAFLCYQQLVNEGLNFRFYWHFPSAMLDTMIDRGVQSYTGSDHLKICGMKIFMDGSLGSQTAWMYDAYPNSTNFGIHSWSTTQLYSMVEKASRHNISSSIHAIGDRCVHEVLSVIDRVQTEQGKYLPHRIEHLQCIGNEDIALLQKTGARVAVQPVHIAGDVHLIQQYWPCLQEQTYAFQTLIQNGICLAFGSDAPVETINPCLGVYAAMERRYQNNPQNQQWMQKECLTLEQALLGYTRRAAEISNSQHSLGIIDVGKQADIVVLENFEKEPTEYWLQTQSQMTMIDGNIVYINNKTI